MKTTAQKAQDPETQREPQDPGTGMAADLKTILATSLVPWEGVSGEQRGSDSPSQH